ncbi:MAG: extracellular solute-binding protein [Niameybacter sp.]|uniref:extracellular solute-binding protein n=1 Tax=Niameybacter sp. TaxID=2033640 RepID=UPI002FC9F60F
MSKKMKKLVVIGMILTTLVGTLAGCGSKEEAPKTEQGTTTQGAQEGSTEKTAEKPKKITYMTNLGIKPEDGHKEWAAAYKELTGVEIEIQNVPQSGELYQKLELSFASGETSDVFSVGDGKLAIYATQGALADLTDMFNNSPLKDTVDPELMESITVNGKIYGVPIENGGGPVTYVRKDWLDKLGMEVPTTYDAYIEMLRGFKSLGEDVIPMTAPGLVAGQAEYYLREFYQDASPDFVQVDGKWVDGMLQANMVPALERMSAAYAEGLMDIEIITNKTSTCRDKWNAGKVGAFTYWAGNWNVNLGDRLVATNPEAEMIAIPAIEGTHYVKRVPVVASISSLAKNPEGIFENFIQVMHDGKEGSMLFQHGVEGIHHEVKDGAVEHLPTLADPSKILAQAFVTPALSTEQVADVNYPLDERITSSLAILEEYGKQAVQVPVSKSLTKVSSDLLALREKTVSSIVLGNTTIEEGLAKYVVEAENLGIDKIVEELNQ